MKYLINKMQCYKLLQQMWWFDGRGDYFHPKGQGIKYIINGVFVVNSGKLTE